MANAPMTFNVPQNYDVQALVCKLRDLYVAKGFIVNTNAFSGTFFLRLEKNIGGINTVLGLGTAITVNISLQGTMLVINYTDAEWTTKIIGLVVGWFLCLIPFVTAVIGSINQYDLPNEISRDITMLLSTVGTVPPSQG